MKIDKRKYIIRKDEWDEYFNALRVLEYKKKTFVLSAGSNDTINVFYYDKNTFAVLSTNFRLGYAGLELIDFNYESSKTPPDESIFIQNTDELELKKDFFDYSINTQADILAQYIY